MSYDREYDEHIQAIHRFRKRHRIILWATRWMKPFPRSQFLIRWTRAHPEIVHDSLYLHHYDLSKMIKAIESRAYAIFADGAVSLEKKRKDD